MEAISHAGICVGILATDGVVLGAEKKISSKLLEVSAGEKMHKIDDHVCCAVAGITADANILINFLRIRAQQELLRHNEPIPVEELVRSVCNRKQGYTQFGGQTPSTLSLPQACDLLESRFYLRGGTSTLGTSSSTATRAGSSLGGRRRRLGRTIRPLRAF